MCRGCQNHPPGVQPFPRGSPLVKRINQALPGFPNRALPHGWEQGQVFAYVLSTLDVQNGKFCQRGGAPNFQGDCITLCTCMRWHRTWSSIKTGVWVAGFCGSKCPGGNQLFYLMRISNTFDSHLELWNELSQSTKRAKCASIDVFGDCYQPRSIATPANDHSVEAYVVPRIGHKHHEDANDLTWQEDVRLCHGRISRLLIGAADTAFIWETPRYRYKKPRHPRFRVHSSLSEFYQYLEINR